MNSYLLNAEIEKREKIAFYIVNTAGSIILDLFHKRIKVSEKSPHDYVSQADKDIERIARKSINEFFSDDSFTGEEQAPTSKSGDFEWIFDPIDGTNNYLRGLPLVGTQISILYKGEIVYGLIYRPFTQDFYHARKGGGSYYQNKLTGEKRKISVSNRPLSESIGIFDSMVGKNNSPSTKPFNYLVDKIAMPRIFGVAVYDIPAIAEGSAEFLITGMAQKYDVAAGWLIVEEAGGKISGLSSKPNIDDDLLMFSNQTVKQDIAEAINE